jgi:HEAT repeat protein
VKTLERRRLVRALSNGNERERWEAATILAREEDPKAVRAVERVFQKTGDEGSRAAAAYVLGFSGDADMASVLAQALADPEESDVVRAYAAEGLGHLLQHEPVLAEVRTAIRVGLRDAAPEVRFWSVFAAGVLGLQELRTAIVHLADTDGEEIERWWSVAEEAEWALRVLNGEEDPPLPQRA